MAIYIKYALWREYVILTAIVCKPTNCLQFRRNFRINNYDVHRPQAHEHIMLYTCVQWLWPLLQVNMQVRVRIRVCVCWYLNSGRIKTTIQQTIWYKCMHYIELWRFYMNHYIKCHTATATKCMIVFKKNMVSTTTRKKNFYCIICLKLAKYFYEFLRSMCVCLFMAYERLYCKSLMWLADINTLNVSWHLNKIAKFNLPQTSTFPMF